MSVTHLLQVLTRPGEIYSHIRKRWLVDKPEERVRQEYLCVLVNEYGYSLDQIDEELEVTGRGSGHARADFAIWASTQDKRDNNNPLIIVECKSDNITIAAADYGQGDNYARLTNARFFVTHNNKETKYWRVVHTKMPKTLEEIDNIPHVDATNEEIEELLQKLKVFKEDEFAKLLHECHNIIRNRDKLDPAAAFDEIAKILFIKVLIERRMRAGGTRQNLFTVEFLDQQGQIYKDPMDTLFAQTKEAYADDKIFEPGEKINLRLATVREIVRTLERYNLSDTSEDIKGIAFERFLGRTFRGEIGQFFTPRPIVEFMIRMLDPKEDEVICDPACGSGGFLIRFFEIVRELILTDVDRQYQEYKAEIEADNMTDQDRAQLLTNKYKQLQETINQTLADSRLWKLANRSIYGCDANPRMARTGKMNMIMHGDGHGGIHHHDGFINVNGIFEGRFDIVLTNPPFGANVEESDIVQEESIAVSTQLARHYNDTYGTAYQDAIDRVKAAINKPVASLYTLPKAASEKTKTEILFIERCLELLKPGGRMGIVLPEGLFNNPSLTYVREFVEDRAFIEAVVSLPEETFTSAKTAVKTSLLFLKKFSNTEQTNYNAEKNIALIDARASQQPERGQVLDLLNSVDSKPIGQEKKMLTSRFIKLEREAQESARVLLKTRLDYMCFMYEADQVGITSTGGEGPNELYRNDNSHSITPTALDYYHEFLRDPTSIPYFTERRLPSVQLPRAFRVNFSDLFRWDPLSFCFIDWHWSPDVMKPLGSMLTPRKEAVAKTGVSFTDLRPMTIHFDGSVDPRKVRENKVYTMDLFYALPGDLVVSKIDLKNGAVGIVPVDWDNVVVTNHFAVYQVDESQVIPEYLHRIIQQKHFKEYLWRHKVGAEGRKEVKLDFFESIEIPVPDLTIQASILMQKQRLLDELESVKARLATVDIEVEDFILGAKEVGIANDIS